MKICIVTTAFPRWVNDDRGIFVLNAARALVKKGLDVRVIAIHSPGSKKEEVFDGVKVIRPQYLPERWEILQKEGGGLPVAWKKNPFTLLALIPFFLVHTVTVARVARDCDIVHANWTLSGFVAWVSKLFHRRPFIVTVQGSDIYQAARMGWVRILTRISLSASNKVIALSCDLQKTTIGLGVDVKKTVVIPNGIEIQNFYPSDSPRENFILFVGSLIPRKGANYLIEAFAKLKDEIPGARLVIVGEGAQRSDLEQMAREHHLDDLVQFVGTVSQMQISSLMQRARVFVLPSLEEGLGVVLLEAIASGTPCIGSRVGGIPDVITEDVGLLVPPMDPDALCSAMRTILLDPDRWQAYSRAARTRAVEKFAWENIADQIIRVYKDTLKEDAPFV